MSADRSPTRDDAHVLDILEAARHARSFVEGTTKDEFIDDAKTQAAVLYELIVLGEATRRVSAAFRDAHPGIPWKSMAETRSVIIHDYDEIDIDQVWKILQRDLPALIPQLEAIALREPE